MRKWSRVVLINLAILLAGIVVVELAFGNWIFGPRLGAFIVPRGVEIRHDLSAIYPGGGIAVYTRDKYGLRGDYGGDPRNIDVLAIGGSTTNELYVSDPDSWVAQLDRMLTDGGYGLKAVNAGIDGHSTYAHLRAFEAWFPNIPGLKPKYVLFYIGINEPLVDVEPLDLALDSSPWRRGWRAIRNDSALYNLFRIVQGAVRAQRVRVAHTAIDLSRLRLTWEWNGDPERVRRLADDYKDKMAGYEQRLRRLEALTRQWGATPVFVTQLRGDARWLGDRLVGVGENAINQALVQRMFNEITLRVCREKDDICIDLERSFKADDGDFYDLVHVVATGSRKVATIIYDGLKARLPPPKPR